MSIECFTVRAVRLPGEVHEGEDLVTLTVQHAQPADGDVVVVSSKVVSKAEGRLRSGPREDVVAAETDRVVARRGSTTVVRTHHGLVMAAAGVDGSNVPAGTVLPLPVDPDESARRLREGIRAHSGASVAVIVSDTAGRAWRTGQTDIAIGVAGLPPLLDHAGLVDAHGNALAVTAPALADQLAGAAEVAMGKLTGRPLAVISGIGPHVLAPDDHGDGAAALVRPEPADLFGYGTREAVRHAVGLGSDGPDLRGFGAPATRAELLDAVHEVLEAAGPGTVNQSVADQQPSTPSSSEEREECTVRLPERDARALGRLEARVAAVAAAHGWRVVDGGNEPDTITLRCSLP